MNTKHTAHFCSCGRIHMLDDDKLDSIFEEGKMLLLICAGCGAATIIGADVEPDYFTGENACIMFTKDFSRNEDTSITTGGEVKEIFYSQGIKVPMKTGGYADFYIGGRFFDTTTPVDEYLIEEKDTKEEILELFNNHKLKAKTVDMNRFIKGTPDDILDEISNYAIDGFNWKNTKYDKY